MSKDIKRTDLPEDPAGYVAKHQGLWFNKCSLSNILNVLVVMNGIEGVE